MLTFLQPIEMARTAVLSPEERKRRDYTCRQRWNRENREYVLMQKKALLKRPEYVLRRSQLYHERKAAFHAAQAKAKQGEIAEMMLHNVEKGTVSAAEQSLLDATADDTSAARRALAGSARGAVVSKLVDGSFRPGRPKGQKGGQSIAKRCKSITDLRASEASQQT